jgi:P pilus assembly chaperone PapD
MEIAVEISVPAAGATIAAGAGLLQNSMPTHKQNKRRIAAAWIMLSGYLLLAPAGWAQSSRPTPPAGGGSPVNLTRDMRARIRELNDRIQSGAYLFDQTKAESLEVANATAGVPIASTVLPQFVFGGGWYTALYFTNSTGAATSFAVNFVGDAGTPLTVPALGGSTTQVNLAAYGTAIVEAPNAGGLLQGYAAFTLPSGVSGYGVFRQTVAGQVEQEAVVPFSDAGATSNTLTWDETNRVTAVAIVNPSSVATTVSVTLWDENGQTVGTSSVALPPHNKTEAALEALPGLSGMVGKRGSAQFQVSGGSVAVLGLRFDGLALTSIPTTAGTATSASTSGVLPQFVFGGGWYTALYFTNFTGTAVSFPVNFVSDAGTPLTVPALGGSTTQVNLAAYGTAIVEAPNAGSLLQGYAAFTLPSGVSGYGVFRQTVAGQVEQEAVVPFSDAGATSNTLTWDETNRVTAVAIVNPSSFATTVDVTLWDENGQTVGTSSVALPPHNKTEAALKALPGLAGMVGKRGSAQFQVSGGSVAVLGLRFDGLALTSIPTTGLHSGASGNLVAQRAEAQTGLAIGQASIVLQSQLSILMAIAEAQSYCVALDGGGSVRAAAANAFGATIYYDAGCTQLYLATSPGMTITSPNNGMIVISETATYYGLNGAVIGSMTLNETAELGDSSDILFGLGTFTPASGARTPVQMGVYCTLSDGGGRCGGGIAQDFPALGLAIGAVTPLTLIYGESNTAPVTFTGGGSAVTGPIGSLTLTNPGPYSLVIQGGTPYTSTTASGGAASFDLFPPTPTAWTLTDSAHDQQFQISVASNTTRNLTLAIIQVSSGAALATGALDQSGTGAITYSDGSIAAVTNWTLAN